MWIDGKSISVLLGRKDDEGKKRGRASGLLLYVLHDRTWNFHRPNMDPVNFKKIPFPCGFDQSRAAVLQHPPKGGSLRHVDRRLPMFNTMYHCFDTSYQGSGGCVVGHKVISFAETCHSVLTPSSHQCAYVRKYCQNVRLRIPTGLE